MRNFQNIFETHKRSFISAFSICMTVSYNICILYVMRCTIWYHLPNLKNVKNTLRRALLLVNFTKSNTPSWVFPRILYCTSGNKSRNASHINFIVVELRVLKSRGNCYVSHIFGTIVSWALTV